MIRPETSFAHPGLTSSWGCTAFYHQVYIDQTRLCSLPEEKYGCLEHSARGAAARGATRGRPHAVVTGVCGIRRRLSLVFLGFRYETVTVKSAHGLLNTQALSLRDVNNSSGPRHRHTCISMHIQAAIRPNVLAPQSNSLGTEPQTPCPPGSLQECDLIVLELGTSYQKP